MKRGHWLGIGGLVSVLGSAALADLKIMETTSTVLAMLGITALFFYMMWVCIELTE